MLNNVETSRPDLITNSDKSNLLMYKQMDKLKLQTTFYILNRTLRTRIHTDITTNN